MGQEASSRWPGWTGGEAGPEEYRGWVVYIYAYDVAYDMKRTPVATLLGQKVEQYAADVSRRSPRQTFTYLPQMVRLPTVESATVHGAIRLERSVKLYPVGAISIRVAVPFVVRRLEDLLAWHDLRPNGRPLAEEVRELAEQVRAELAPVCIRPHAALREGEAYTVFCVHAPPGGPAAEWLEGSRGEVAALLMEEDASALSRQEAAESTALALSYYQDDLVVVDWNAALVVDRPANFGGVLHVMELANLQLAELEAYDTILDEALYRSYRDLARRGLFTRRDALGPLREIRVDLARLSDELGNITKFFGDWHLARVYQGVSGRFHLGDWQRVVEQKLTTLNNLYQMLKQDQTNRWMIILEASIVLLFIIDVVILFAGLANH